MANDIGIFLKKKTTKIIKQLKLKQENNIDDESSRKVFEEVLLNLNQLACQQMYFDPHVNWISELDMQHNDERQGVSRGLF